MTTLSSAAWVIHDVGLAAAIGGPLFEYTALAPTLERSADARERTQISLDAAQRFSLVKLLGHASFAIPWLVGRTMRSGGEVSATAHALTRAKDILVGISLVSGVLGLIGVRRAAERVEGGEGAQQARESERSIPTKAGALGVAGVVNMLANVGILGLTALLAMEGNKSVRFSASSRRLP